MKTKQHKLQKLSRILVIAAALAFILIIFLPIWRIELTAPQYPEGLELFIYSNKLAGEVEIINGLNHYIGMKELHEDEFMEFAVLPYIIGGIALLGLIAGLLNNRRLFFGWMTVYIIFGMVALIDFYMWLYDYGHDLDPNAAIQVPGMVYQPPMFGYKQLLNFGAYSVPDWGGILLFLIGFVLVLIAFMEIKAKKKAIN